MSWFTRQPVAQMADFLKPVEDKSCGGINRLVAADEVLEEVCNGANLHQACQYFRDQAVPSH
jgi:hypothetical protein